MNYDDLSRAGAASVAIAATSVVTTVEQGFIVENFLLFRGQFVVEGFEGRELVSHFAFTFFHAVQHGLHALWSGHFFNFSA